MPNIMTITLNPALDLSTVTETVRPGPKIRCAAPVDEPGGGGVNVSRTIRALGGRSLAVVCLGGTTGTRLLNRLDHEGITSIRFEIPGETRQSFSVTDASSKAQYRYVMPGPEWAGEDEKRLLALVAKLLRGQERIVLSGSLPDGVSGDITRALNDLGESVGASLAVDISGEHLSYLVAQPSDLWLMRMDKSAAEGLAGRKLNDTASVAEFAGSLVDTGVARNVIIGSGSSGVVLVGESGRFHGHCPTPDAAGHNGAGDSLIAAYVLSISEGQSAEDALKRGVAASIASMTRHEAGSIWADEFAALIGQVVIDRI